MPEEDKHMDWNCKQTIMPGDDACIMSGLNRATSEIILGLSAKERGTFWYHGQGKLHFLVQEIKAELAKLSTNIKKLNITCNGFNCRN